MSYIKSSCLFFCGKMRKFHFKLCQVFAYNFQWQNIWILLYHWCVLKVLLCRNWLYFFFHLLTCIHLLGCHAIGIISLLFFLKSFALFKVTPRQMSNISNTIRIIFIKIIILIKFNSIKIYSKNMYLKTNKYNFIKICFIK